MDLVRVMVYFASMGMGNLALLSCAVNPTTQLLTHNALVDFTRYGEIEGLVKARATFCFCSAVVGWSSLMITDREMTSL